MINIKNIYLAVRKRWRIAFSGRYFVAQRTGIRWLLDAYGYIDRRIDAYGIYEQEQLQHFIDQVIQLKPSLFIDAGANMGLYTVNIASRFPAVKVIAFEPDARNRAQLFSNLLLNEIIDAVLVEDVALSDRCGMAKFNRHHRENPGRSMISENGEYSVHLRRLDDMIGSFDERIAIKIDVEGHELQLLKGARRILEENECVIQVESFDPEGVFGFLGELGYSLQKQFGNDFFFTRRLK